VALEAFKKHYRTKKIQLEVDKVPKQRGRHKIVAEA